jgi:hypothetical protein
MPRKKGKAVSFDAMVKFFMQHYDIPTKTDVEKIMHKLDRLEEMINGKQFGVRRSKSSANRSRSGKTAFETVLAIIREFKQGIGVNEIKARTGFEDKKIRNIIFRLSKKDMIQRKSRGIYIAK